MICGRISRASALFLLLIGMPLLFAADEIVPRLVPGFPPAGAWVAQLLAAPCLAVAALNWLNRSLLLGGIHGRPVVMTNAVMYFIAATVLAKAGSAPRGDAVALIALLVVLFAAIYVWLLFQGPFEHDRRRAAARG